MLPLKPYHHEHGRLLLSEIVVMVIVGEPIRMPHLSRALAYS